MTKILILIFTVLLALNVNASDTEPVKSTSTTGVDGILSGHILVELTNPFGPIHNPVIDTEVYFEIIERSQDELGIIINYNQYTVELFIDPLRNNATYTVTKDDRGLDVIDDPLKHQLFTITRNIQSKINLYIPIPYGHTDSLRKIFQLLTILTEVPGRLPIHNNIVKSTHPEHFTDTPSNLTPTTDLWVPWTMICDSIGYRRTATFDEHRLQHKQYVTVDVGDPASGCLGRSGPGCGAPSTEEGYLVFIFWEWRWKWVVTGRSPAPKTQYTQESLNHDVCVDHYGWWGDMLAVVDCTDEFIIASPGFLQAPSCF